MINERVGELLIGRMGDELSAHHAYFGISPVPVAVRRRRFFRATAVVAATLLVGACGVPVTPSSVPTRQPLTPPPTASFSPPSSPTSSPSPASPPPPAGSPSPVSSSTPTYAGPWPRPRWCRPGAAGAAVHGAVRLPILYYHRVEQPPADYLTWTVARQRAFITYDTLPQALAAQLDWLARNGYMTILPADLAAHWANGCRLPARPVILTFDDGTPDWVSAILPLLRAHGMVAEFYVTLDAIAEHHISWPEVATLAANGMGIGAHDVHHVQLALLGGSRPPASPATMWFEVDQARRRIGTRVGTLPDSMAYVGGGFDATLVALVGRAGYSTARSIQHGVVQDWVYRFELRVVRVGVYDDVINRTAWTVDLAVPVFAAKVSGRAD